MSSIGGAGPLPITKKDVAAELQHDLAGADPAPAKSPPQETTGTPDDTGDTSPTQGSNGSSPTDISGQAGNTQGQGLPLSNDPTQATSNNAPPSDAYKGATPALQQILQSNGDAGKIDGDSWQALAKAFPSFTPAEQKSVKDLLNSTFPGTNTKSGVSGGDALQYSADGLAGNDPDAAKNHLVDLQSPS